MRRGEDHWIYTVITITLGFIALYFLARLYLAFVNAEW